MAIDVNDLLDSYKKQRRGYLDEILSVQQQIHYINSNVDLAMIGITADCISQCRTGRFLFMLICDYDYDRQ